MTSSHHLNRLSRWETIVKQMEFSDYILEQLEERETLHPNLIKALSGITLRFCLIYGTIPIFLVKKVTRKTVLEFD